MKAITVIILALLGIVGGRNILLSKEEDPQMVNQEPSRHPALGVQPGEQLATVDMHYPRKRSNENFIDNMNKILELIFKDFDNLAASNEALVKHDSKNAEAETTVEVSEDDHKMDDNTVFEDRALAGDYCVNGTQRVGNSCWPVV